MAGTNSNTLVFEDLGKGLENLIELFLFPLPFSYPFNHWTFFNRGQILGEKFIFYYTYPWFLINLNPLGIAIFINKEKAIVATTTLSFSFWLELMAIHPCFSYVTIILLNRFRKFSMWIGLILLDKGSFVK